MAKPNGCKEHFWKEKGCKDCEAVVREAEKHVPSAGLHGSTANSLDGAQDALNRMRRAAKRRTGCHLTAEMISSLELTLVGEMWGEEDPRNL